MIIDYTEQGTPEWLALRLGRPSASRASEILTMTGVVSKQRGAYLDELAGQAVSGRIENGYKSQRMQDGNDNEDQNRALFEIHHDCEVTRVGCCFPDEERKFLCSPDGLILEWGEGLELKDASFTVQIERLRNKKPKPEHWCQMQFSMLVTGYKAWWYQSYCQGLPALTLRIERDEKYVTALEQQLDFFCEELKVEIEWLKSL